MDPLVDLRGVLAASKVHEHTAAPEVGLHEVEADLRQVRASIWEKRLVVFKDDDWLVPVPALRFSHRQGLWGPQGLRVSRVLGL